MQPLEVPADSETSALRAKRAAYSAFREALLHFADEPTPYNFARYLTASRALEESRGRRPRRLAAAVAVAEAVGSE